MIRNYSLLSSRWKNGVVILWTRGKSLKYGRITRTLRISDHHRDSTLDKRVGISRYKNTTSSLNISLGNRTIKRIYYHDYRGIKRLYPNRKTLRCLRISSS